MKQQLNSKELKECVGGATAIEYGLTAALDAIMVLPNFSIIMSSPAGDFLSGSFDPLPVHVTVGATYL